MKPKVLSWCPHYKEAFTDPCEACCFFKETYCTGDPNTVQKCKAVNYYPEKNVEIETFDEQGMPRIIKIKHEGKWLEGAFLLSKTEQQLTEFIQKQIKKDNAKADTKKAN